MSINKTIVKVAVVIKEHWLSINKNRFALAVKVVIIIWGILSVLQGAGLSFIISGPDAYKQSAFIELVYGTVFIAGLISVLLSSRIAAFVLCGATLAAIAIIGHGVSYDPSLILDITIRPVLVALVLFFISRYERGSAERHASAPWRS
jgi:hypothetical protein